jgi:hypothetical protein
MCCIDILRLKDLINLFIIVFGAIHRIGWTFSVIENKLHHNIGRNELNAGFVHWYEQRYGSDSNNEECFLHHHYHVDVWNFVG